MAKVNYGIDAPGIMQNLQAFGSLAVAAGIAVILYSANVYLKFVGILVVVGGSFFLILGLAMLAYGLRGKYRTRDLMLAKVKWTGSENVLDIGTG